MKIHRKGLKTVFGLIMALCMVIASFYVPSFAASKKTVRVATAKELKEAIADSKVGTVIFRSGTYDSITIAADANAKSKKLIIDAQNANIVNKAVFKKIEIQNVNSFKEAASGNTLEMGLYTAGALEVAKKKKVKKLILSDLSGYEGIDRYWTVRKSAKIKNIVFKFGNDTAKWDKTTGKLSFDICAFEWGEEGKAVMTLDSAGRMLSRSEDFQYENDAEYTFKYDKNGNMVNAVAKILADGEMIVKGYKEYTYGSGNRLVSGKVLEELSPEPDITSYTYDKKGRVISEEFTGPNTGTGTTTYTYDSKGRLLTKVKESDLENVFEKYTYNENGWPLTIEGKDNYNSFYEEDTYDDAGNMIKAVCTFDEEVTVTHFFTYDKKGNWTEQRTVYPDGTESFFHPGEAG